eukprot:TRINITY_DN11324_c0_g2_i1.p1 TRINITY_DN11324_c0_g2~~TRINITY_DN11324_c0_g2_i1.p1  ORF type:complete len:901 (+),score=162.11 TRINITY_DN11324_c0_g2_i1:232-2934(+)
MSSSQSGDFISVYARVRPSDRSSAHLALRPQTLELTVPRGAGLEEQPPESYAFAFAEVLGPEASQQRVFDRVAKDLVLGALEGVNCSLFAYGQTGSGKTFTMCGGKANYMRDRGIIPRTLSTIFEAIDAKNDDVHYNISMSMIEIYKEIGRDLLTKGEVGNSKARAAVTVSLVKGDQPVLIGAKRVALASEEDGLQQYCLGEVQRTVAETSHNLASSRSHCVCTIFIEASDPGAQVVRTSKIQIVDLAGSERLKPYEKGSQEKKSLMNEAVSINLSLHHLSVVITALNNSSKLVPYRNSFLTKLLKDALGGNAKAAMIMTVDPSDDAMPETISSCRFAQRVANVKTNARVNEERDPQLVIAELKRRNAELEAAAGSVSGGAAEEDVPDEELRRRIQAFLEDDSGGVDGGSALKVGPMPRGALAAFRIFRELFWAGLLDGSRRPRRPTDAVAPEGQEQQQPELQRETSWLTAAERLVSPDGKGSDPTAEGVCKTDDNACNGESGNMNASASDSSCQALLAECQAECRMLRAALAAQPAPRPTKKAPSRSSKESKLQADLLASQGECKRLRAALAAFASSGRTAPPPKPRSKAKAKTKRSASSDRSRSFASSTTLQGSFSAEDTGGSIPRESSLQRSAMARPSSQPGPFEAKPSVSRQVPERCSTADGHASDDRLPDRATPVDPPSESHNSAVVEPAKPASKPSGSSNAWLQATTALSEEDLTLLGTTSAAYHLFLRRDPRAGDIWQSELQKLGNEKKACMDEARSRGEEVALTKEAISNAQLALENLKGKLREVEEAASIDAAVRPKAEMLRNLVAAEEPKLELLLQEKTQSYKNGCARLKELKHELIHIEHAQKALEVTVQSEFERWRTAVEQRYPMEVAAAVAASAAASTVGLEEGVAG